MNRYQIVDMRWITVLRIVDGLYFLWRGIFKMYTPTSVWLIPRVTQALPTTPLAPIIRTYIFPHVVVFGYAVGVLEIFGGGLLVLGLGGRIPPFILFILNTVFFLTLGFKEPHDMELNLLMGIMNLMFAMSVQQKATKQSTAT
ncbi:DoxX family membrane protein [Sulfobacillus thermosulfidooxidans]|uniref:DoxX protein n=1 Tax=Sulfobacillus thermosulfidooxidans (strain DSM 9293 / VKM B-1269 / AT-1) TaxID=929705 RepID=A0A1W1W8M2_SULTA|nr:DoxX family membrane protein [Sulfobacillus thermosulfidooxidans]OLZ10455.1 hypothetical protein BFX05_01045 [Sulfobacillus thermosulfidooxidans]OLZ14289.1 hypothetical protein BFX06_08375 [Sulfobacillus thermosulfidooxidans]OLZ19032.1 hypothetical protein BFX07_04770 [Sulfobacillus thermosulfidooxidans]SMC02542.1 DoxX protein [Sulfobacillus thermosulfidooxidans DSM 9293]